MQLVTPTKEVVVPITYKKENSLKCHFKMASLCSERQNLLFTILLFQAQTDD